LVDVVVPSVRHKPLPDEKSLCTGSVHSSRRNAPMRCRRLVFLCGGRLLGVARHVGERAESGAELSWQLELGAAEASA
jgi:hypothetical protein